MPNDPPVPEQVPRIRYAANGAQTAYAVPFLFFASADVKVWLNAAPQSSGFTLAGAGQPCGGTVTFDTPPADGVTITLERRMPLARRTAFQESGALTAAALNRDFDALTLQGQQTAAEQALMLRFDAKEATANTAMPDKGVRANKALAFDGDGNPTVVPHGSSIAAPDFIPAGAGAAPRSMQDKLAEGVSVKDFGAVGDGIADDTLAVQAALAAAQTVFVPAGTYRISQPIDIGFAQRLYGAGQGSTLAAASNNNDLLRLPNSYAQIDHLRLEGGAAGIRLFGRDGPCVQNAIQDVTIWGAETGLVLDGYTDTQKPCYWNNIDRLLVVQHRVHGVHLMRSGAGDTPNANRFHMLRVYSLAVASTGVGIYVEAGRFNNAFTDCEVNLETTASACVRVGPEGDKNLFVNLYTETLAAIDNIVLDAGSQETSIVNLFSASAGKAIQDYSGGDYIAINAGFPDKNRLTATRITDLTVELLRYDTAILEAAGEATLSVDLSASMNLASAYGGTLTAALPKADAPGSNGAAVTIKKTDASPYAVVVTETDGPGPDGRAVRLTKQYDAVTVVSNGAGWWVVHGSVEPGSYAFDESAGLVEPDVRRPVTLVSAAAGDTQVRLPPADGFDVPGRTLTLKRTDDSAHAMTVTEHGGPGPDGRAHVLGYKGAFLTVASNGAAWWVVGGDRLTDAVLFSEATGTVPIDAQRRFYMISAFGGDVDVQLPPAVDPENHGRLLTIKRADAVDAHRLTISERGGTGPDGAVHRLGVKGAYLTVASDGAGWQIVGGSPLALDSFFSEAGGTIAIDTTRRLHVISAFVGDTVALLPNAADAANHGRVLTVKRADSNTTNSLTVQEDGGPGPDSVALTLGNQGHAVTVMSDGAFWRILSMHP